MYRLLIADDEKLEREALRFIIQKGSDAIEEIRDASNGREAVVKARQFRPHICFLDIKMPGVSGIDAARQIQELVPGVRVVFLTAFDYFDYAKEAIRIGVDDFIVKPASETNVIEVIERITADLDRRRSVRERTERVEQKLDRVVAVLEVELSEGLARGFVAPEKLAEYAALKEFRFESIIVVRTVLDYDSYPMKIEEDGQRAVLCKRCMRLMQQMLRAQGWLVITVGSVDGLSTVCLLPPGTRFVSDLEEVAKRTRREFSIETRVAVSTASADVERIEELLLQARNVEGRPSSKETGRVRCYDRGDHPSLSSSPGPFVNQHSTKAAPPAARGERAMSAGTPFPPAAMEGRLIGAILGSDRKGAFTAADDIHRWLVLRSRSVRELRTWTNEFFVVVRYSLSRRLPGIRIEGSRLLHDLAKARGGNDIRVASHGHLGELLSVCAGCTGGVPNTVRRTQEYIEAHFFEECSLGALAANIRQSTSHLSRLFKRYTGLNVVEYVNAIRVLRARQLLTIGRFTVKEVSLKVGYANPGYFARVFRRLEGVSPSVFRDRVTAPTDSDS